MHFIKRDQDIDIIVMSKNESYLKMLISNGYGGFSLSTQYNLVAETQAIVADNFNYHGKNDIATVSNNGDFLYFILHTC